jgi:hypothetical protein
LPFGAFPCCVGFGATWSMTVFILMETQCTY